MTPTKYACWSYVIFCQADEFPCAVVCQQISILDLSSAGITHVRGSRRNVCMNWFRFLPPRRTFFVFFSFLSNSARSPSHVLDKELFLLEIGNKFIDSKTLDGCEILIVGDTAQYNGKKTIYVSKTFLAKIDASRVLLAGEALFPELWSCSRWNALTVENRHNHTRQWENRYIFHGEKKQTVMTSTFHWITLTKEPTFFFSSPSRCLLPFTVVYELRLPQSDNTRVWSCSRLILCVSALPTTT